MSWQQLYEIALNKNATNKTTMGNEKQKPGAVQGTTLPANVADAFVAAKQQDESVYDNLAAENFKFPEGQKIMVAASGLTTMSFERDGVSKDIEAVEMVLENGENAVNSNAVFVSAFRRAVKKYPNKKYYIIQVENKGEKDGKDYLNLDCKLACTVE